MLVQELLHAGGFVSGEIIQNDEEAAVADLA
jgi:hypothetical protein